MTAVRAGPTLPFAEFVALMAAMMALIALAIDAILPALGEIGTDLRVASANDTQLLISLIFIGMALGQLIYGPLSDSVGRKPAVLIGMGIFVLGCLLSALATDFETMLLGRLLQGIGVGAPRTISIALVRDLYQGAAMARVVSFTMTVFIMVPMIAPALGQGILWVADWRAIFMVILALGVMLLLWFMLRQPETLPPERRLPFSLRQVGLGMREIFSNRIALGYTLASGIVFGAFLAYLSTVQQVFQQQYALGDGFALVFAGLSLAIGAASYVNARLVMRLGMQRMSRQALLVICGSSIAFFVLAHGADGHPPLWWLLSYYSLVLFCTGILFGNMNALAMEPLGHIAGIGAAVVGSLSTLISAPLGIGIARAYAGGVEPLVLGYAGCGVVALLVMGWAEGKRGK